MTVVIDQCPVFPGESFPPAQTLVVTGSMVVGSRVLPFVAMIRVLPGSLKNPSLEIMSTSSLTMSGG